MENQQKLNASSPPSPSLVSRSAEEIDHLQNLLATIEEELDLYQRKLIAATLPELLKEHSVSIGKSQEVAAELTSTSTRSIRKWIEKSKVGGEWYDSSRGQYTKTWSLLTEERVRSELIQWVRTNATKKGEPNATVEDFQAHINEQWKEHLQNGPVSVRTTLNWLHELGFKYKDHTKGIYKDGHEREDVVLARELYITKWFEIESKRAHDGDFQKPEIIPPRLERKIVPIFHDETICHSNEDQKASWADDSNGYRAVIGLTNTIR